MQFPYFSTSIVFGKQSLDRVWNAPKMQTTTFSIDLLLGLVRHAQKVLTKEKNGYILTMLRPKMP